MLKNDISHIRGIIKQSVANNPSGVQSAFNVAVGANVLHSIESKKAEIGSNILQHNVNEK